MSVWQTPSIELAEEMMARYARRLADTVDTAERYQSAGIPVPADIRDEYRTRSSRLQSFADMWGFDCDVPSLDSDSMTLH